MFGFQVELPPEPKGYAVESRPIRDVSEAIQEVCTAIMEGRLHIVNTIRTQPELAVDSQIVIEPKTT